MDSEQKSCGWLWYQFKRIKYDVDFQYLFTTEDSTYTFYPLKVKDRVTESSAYIQDAWSLGPLINIVAGLRASKYSLHEKLYFEPRFSAKYALNDQLFIKYSGGLYRQFLVTANQPDELFRIVDLWLGVPGDRSAPRSLHHIIGLEYLTEKNVLMRLEVYRKDFSHLLTLKSEQSSETQCNLCVNETSVTALNDFGDTDAESIGVEALLKKRSGVSRAGWVIPMQTHVILPKIADGIDLLLIVVTRLSVSIQARWGYWSAFPCLIQQEIHILLYWQSSRLGR